MSFETCLESLTENLTCFVCLNIAEDPAVLPCCGQLACKECLERWTDGHDTCPCCRRQFSQKIRPVKWACDFRKLVGALKQLTSEGGFCEQHRKPAEFVCSECCKYLCPDCIFEELAHKSHDGHTISRLIDVLGALKNEISDKMSELIELNNKVRRQADEVRKFEEMINSAQTDQKIAMCHYFRDAGEIVKEAFEQHRERLTKGREALMIARRKALQMYNEGDKLLKDPRGKRRGEIPEMIERIRELREEIDTLTLPIPYPTPQDEYIPPYIETTFELTKFRESIERGQREPSFYFFTNDVKIYGCSWRLKVYPWGNRNGEGTHVSIFLELRKANNGGGNYVYKTEIFSSNIDESPIVRQYESHFQVNDSWGWNKAISIDRVLHHDFLDEAGSLIVHLKIRPATYHQAYVDLRGAIKAKKRKIEELKRAE